MKGRLANFTLLILLAQSLTCCSGRKFEQNELKNFNEVQSKYYETHNRKSFCLTKGSDDAKKGCSNANHITWGKDKKFLKLTIDGVELPDLKEETLPFRYIQLEKYDIGKNYAYFLLNTKMLYVYNFNQKIIHFQINLRDHKVKEDVIQLVTGRDNDVYILTNGNICLFSKEDNSGEWKGYCTDTTFYPGQVRKCYDDCEFVYGNGEKYSEVK